MSKFELKYKITDGDVKAVNKSVMWTYFVPYLVVSVLGLSVGIIAAALKPRAEIFVLGVILIALGAILLVCTAMLAIAPKNFVSSALMTSEETERTVVFSDGGITVVTEGQSDIEIGYFDIARVKNKKTYLLLYLGKDSALIVKDAVISGQTLSELFEFAESKIKGAPASASQTETNKDIASDAENAEATETTAEGEACKEEKP